MKKTLLFAFVSLFAMQANAATQDLIDSVKAGNTQKVIELLNNGENVNGTNGIGTTALHYAVASDNAEITQILLSYGADLNAANSKGWTPLKIAEKKDLKNVTPVLVQYLQLQKASPAVPNEAEVQETVAAVAEAVEIVKEAPKQAKEAVVEAVEIVKEAPEQAKEAVVDVVKEAPAQVAEAVFEPAIADLKLESEVTDAAQVQNSETVVNGAQPNYQEIVEMATQAVIEARSEKNKAETEVKILADELKQVKAEKAELEAKLAEKEKAKPEVKAETKAEVKETPKEEAKKEVKTPAAAKPAPKPVKPVLQKKPVYKAPQPIVKKAVIKPSAMVEGIYAGDEEIVYCLDYLGNGENDTLKRAAGYFAASASISEARYQQIVDKSNAYFMNASDADMAVRDTECSKIITPSDHNKQNQIVRSMNKSVGY